MTNAIQRREAQEIAQQAPSNALTPMEMLDRAVSQGASIEVLERLMGLQERWEKNQARKEFDQAISDAKAEIEPITKNREGHNNKRYADFAALARAVDPIITKHGLSYRFRTTQDEKIHVTCVLSHRGGHSEETTLSGPADTSGSKNAIQAIGSTLTYLQRYSLTQALGLAASDDDDGRSAGMGETISDEQAEEIRRLIEESHTNIERFCRVMKIESVPDMLKRDYPAAIQALNERKNKAAK